MPKPWRAARTVASSLAFAVVLGCAGSAWCDDCDEGVVIDNLEEGTLEVTYVTRDERGNPVLHEVTALESTQFLPQVETSTTFDEATGKHVYTYTISNAFSSDLQIGDVEFAIPTDVPVEPAGVSVNSDAWMFLPNANRDGGMAWGFMVGTPREDMTVEGIPQGGSVTFSLKSAHAPGPMSVYLRGDVPEPVFETELPGCIDAAWLQKTGFPEGYIRVDTTGPMVAP